MTQLQEVEWFLCPSRQTAFVTKLHNLEAVMHIIGNDWAKKNRTLLIVDACFEWEIQGLALIHGAEPHFHFIRNGVPVRFTNHIRWQYFIYPYDPTTVGVDYTDYAA